MPRISVGRTSRAARAVGLVAFAAAALLVPSASFGAAKIKEGPDRGKPDVDTRAGKGIPPGQAQRAAAEELDARVRWTHFGTAQSLIKPRGYLKRGIAAPSAAAAAKEFVGAHKALWKLSSTDGLKVEKTIPIGAQGRAVVMRQQAGGLEVSPDGVLTVGVVDAGGTWDVAYASSTVTDDETLNGAATLTPEQAYSYAATAAGHPVSVTAVQTAGEAGSYTRLEVGGLAVPQLVKLVAFPTADRGLVPAYETWYADGVETGYRQYVDAASGEILLRENTVDNAVDNPTWLVWPANPHAALDEFPWNYPSADERDLWCWVEMPKCKLAVANQASPREWDVDGRTMVPSFTTHGNNATTTERWDGNAGTNYRPTSPTRDYVYPWTNVWHETRCDPANLAVVGVSNDISAAVANLFAMHNRMHDWTYNLGFTEERWNAQAFNYGKPTAQNDPVDGRAQASARTGGYPTYSGRDNANMNSTPDGGQPITNMFLWQPIAGSFYAPCVDGDYDMSVIGHEYGHMVENRLIAKGGRRSGNHAGAMGESFGDLMAMEYLNEYNFVPAGGGDNPIRDSTVSVIGRYATGNDVHGIRNYDMGFPQAGQYPQAGKYPYVNPLNFSDVGYDIVGRQEHADGEIWSATNYTLRSLLLDRYPSLGHRIQKECADGQRPAEACPGNRRWIQILFDGLFLMPPRPTFLDARDAYLAADLMRFGGANQDLLWLGFAQRGFGQNAATSGSPNQQANDADPIPDFESPLAEEETLTFEAVSQETGNPVPVNVYVGHYERGVTPIADTDPATTSANLDNVARFVPNDEGYEFTAMARGYGHVRFTVKPIRPGEARTVVIRMPTNWASRHNGAVASGDGTRHDQLIDDTEGTNWESTGVPVEGRQVLVKLSAPAQVDRVKVSAFLQQGQNRYTALREFEVYGCTAGTGGQETITIGTESFSCRRIVKSQEDAFPGEPPRPVGPDLNLRTWEAGGGQAVTHVVIRVIDNQCTGNEAFQGEQDNDPLNQTDCRLGALPPANATFPPRNLEVRIAELQVYSSKPQVDGATQED
jgi:hypothetical protein